MSHSRPLTAADNIGKVCGCTNCIAAGVGEERMRRVPGPDGKPIWIHAEALRDWLKSYREMRAKFRSAMDTQGLDPKKLKNAMEGRR